VIDLKSFQQRAKARATWEHWCRLKDYLGSSQILVSQDFEAARNSPSTLDESAITLNFTKSWEEPKQLVNRH
jgi:hypothetical protein